MAGIHIFNQSFITIGVLFDSAFHNTITQAVEPIGEAFHQKPTPKANAHHKISTQGIHFDCSIAITGNIATVIGILSIIADNIAVNQSINIAVRSILFSA